MKRSFYLNYAVAMIIVSVVMLTIYATIQQNYRTGLNDPQMQLARDLGRRLEQGEQIDSSFDRHTFDIAKSLSPFIVLYDAFGKPLHSTALLHGKLPQVPVAVFDEVGKNGEQDLSWQPAKGIRMAMVIVKTNANPVQFVAAGRSMQEVEMRIGNMRLMIFISWMICMAIIVLAAIIQHFKK